MKLTELFKKSIPKHILDPERDVTVYTRANGD